MRYLISLLIVIAACGPVRSTSDSRPSLGDVTPYELSRARSADLLTHLEMTRPAFRTKYGTAVVFINGRHAGGLEALRIPVALVAEVRLYRSTTSAPVEYRVDDRPAIVVGTKR